MMKELFGQSLENAFIETVGEEYIEKLIRDSKFDNGLVWEQNVERDFCDKISISFESHKKRIIDSDYSRAPYPSEVLGIAIARLTQVLPESIYELYDEIFDGVGEYTNCAMQVMHGHLRISQYADCMIWKDDKYIPPISKVWYNTLYEFPIDGLKIGEHISMPDIVKRSPRLVEYLMGVEYEKLPPDVARTTSLFLPKHDDWLPIGIAGVCENYTLYPAELQVSRGIKK